MDARQPESLQAEIDALREQHRIADLRLQELDRRVWLSPDEQIEFARLKKQKLRLKDEIRVLGSRTQGS